MSNSEEPEKEIPSDIIVEKLQKLFFKNIFHETKLKLCIFQSGQRRKNINYVHRSNVKIKPIENGIEKTTKNKLGKWAFDENDMLPSKKVLNEIKLDRILEGLINLCELASKELNRAEEIGSPQGKWSALCTVIEEQQKDEIKVENLQKDLKEKKLKLRELRSKMENHRIKAEQRFKEQHEIMSSLRYDLKNMHRLNQLELKLVRKWEENRYTQATIVTQNAELFLRRQIRKHQHLHEAEECRIRESEKFMATQMADYSSSIAEWQQKFSEKLKKCEKTKQEQEEEIFDLRKRHASQCEIYKERVKYIKGYLREKAAEEELLRQEMHRIESAVHIQAWWRGIMVRHGFGQFRKKTKKNKKSKK